jgi:chemotaxis signal transduction protein
MKIVKRGVLFVFTEEEGTVGGLIDRVSEVVRLSEDQIRPIECASDGKGMLCGVSQLGDTGRMVQLLDIPAIARLRRTHPSLKLTCPA